MYLREFSIKGIKCFEHASFDFPHAGDDYSGWIVLLGGNGMGKSTLLQAMAVALMGPVPSARLLNPEHWVRNGHRFGEIEASLVGTKGDSTPKNPRKSQPYHTRFALTGRDEVTIDGSLYDQPQLVHLTHQRTRRGHMSGPYSAKSGGWFSCGYGPFRRLMGGSVESMEHVQSSGRDARFVTLFSEAAALTYCTKWLSSLYSRSIDELQQEKDRERAGKSLRIAWELIDMLLPADVQITRIDSERVYFEDGGGAEVAVSDLSDGYRSFLALTIDVLRHLDGSTDDLAALIARDGDGVRIIAAGVVLIDEVDAHLHPWWQREIGFRLRRAFPKMQFIVTSHSPFVAQASSDDGLIVLQPAGEDRAVEALRPVKSVKGWRVDQILTSPLFGLEATRDEETEALIRRHAGLVAKRSWGPLSASEKTQLARIEDQLSDRLTAPGETVEERRLQAAMDAYVSETLAKVGGTK